MHLKLFFDLLLSAFLVVMTAKAVAQESGSQQVSMNQEIIEALWNILSPTCKSEMETALSSRGEISPACRSEVQSGLVELKVIPDPVPPFESDQTSSASEGGLNDDITQHNVPNGSNSHVLLAILGFVVFLFGSATLYVLYLNANAPADSNKRVKKLSKKKEEKLRQKGNR
eukprot:gene2405-2553_t